MKRQVQPVEGLVRAAMAGSAAIMDLLNRHEPHQIRGHKKADGSLVTEADLASQDAIQNALTLEYPRATIMSEEGDPVHPERRTSRELLVVDPLDGTTNFSRGSKTWAISVALLQDEEPALGVVLQPETGDLYYAANGSGAFHENLTHDFKRRLSCRSHNLADAIISINCDQHDSESRELWWRWMSALRPPTTFRLRIIECASLELSWVAANAVDAYVHPTDRPWDMAAGGLIVREAGGDVFAPNGGSWDPLGRGVIAVTRELGPQLKDTLPLSTNHESMSSP